MFLSRVRTLARLVGTSRYTKGVGWHVPAPDGSRIVRRNFLSVRSFQSLITPNGLSVPLEGRDDLDATLDIFFGGHYQAMKEAIRPGTVFVDIGANLGVTSLTFAQLDDVDHVYAYEPMPHTFACAQMTLRANPAPARKVTLHQFGVGDRDGELEISYTKKAKCAIGTARIPDDLVKRYGITAQDMRQITVHVADADRILRSITQRHPGSPIALKIDAEGAEYGIVDRLAKTGALGQIYRTTIEWHFEPGPNPMVSQLKAAGFQVKTKELERDGSIGLIDAWR